MPAHPSIPDTREFPFKFLRGGSNVDCSDLLLLATVAALCMFLGVVAYVFRVQEEWQQVALKKRTEDAAVEDAVFLELEAGRRYNIPVEHLRGMEIRVR
jgi:hypothetical protein